MFDLKDSDVSVNGVGGIRLDALFKGSPYLVFGETIVPLSDVHYIPRLGYNLFSSIAAFDGITYDTIGGQDMILTSFGGSVVFELDEGGQTLLSLPRVVMPLNLLVWLCRLSRNPRRPIR